MDPDLLSLKSLSSLLAIVLMDLMLAGDNALIIGLVARRLPKNRQRRIILCGTLGAVVVRAAMAVSVVYVLAIPGFMAAGGAALVWVARKLVKPSPTMPENRDDGAPGAMLPAATFAGALRTIIVADAVMGVDNALAIGGMADGNVVLIVLGLAISVPIVVWGSQLVIWLVDRFPSIVLLGAVLLGWTAYSMLLREPLLHEWFAHHPEAGFGIAIMIFLLCLSPRFGWGRPGPLEGWARALCPSPILRDVDHQPIPPGDEPAGVGCSPADEVKDVLRGSC